jgi:hypothetical protein
VYRWRQKWEYRIISIEAPDVKWLNSLGEQGWELVTIESETIKGRLLIFKREKAEGA